MKLLLILAMSCAYFMSHGQTLTPNEQAEYCPRLNYTFQYVMHGKYTAISIGNLTNASLNVNPNVLYDQNVDQTTITFGVEFTDNNSVEHKFRINRTPDGGTATFTEHTFVKIKSHFASRPIPNMPVSFSVPACQTNPFLFTITPTKWIYSAPDPDLEFGTVTDYDYIIPAGWVLNGQTSTGSNIIRGNASVTITPDATVNMPIHELPEGVYIVEVRAGNHIERKKIKILR